MAALMARPKRRAPRQEALLECLRDWKRNPLNQGNNPTYEQLATLMGVSVPTAYNTAMRMVVNGTLALNPYGKLIIVGWVYPEDFAH